MQILDAGLSMESFKEGISLIESHFYAFDPNFAVGVSSVLAQASVCWSYFHNYCYVALSHSFAKLHSNLQTQLNFSWLEKELTLFPKEGMKKVRLIR